MKKQKSLLRSFGRFYKKNQFLTQMALASFALVIAGMLAVTASQGFAKGEPLPASLALDQTNWADGETVTGLLTLSATASNFTPDSVTFRITGSDYSNNISGVDNGGGQWSTNNAFDTSGLSAGTYSVQAEAVASGSSIFSESRSFVISAAPPEPSITLDLPLDAATVSGSSVPLQTTVSNASAAYVQFFLGETDLAVFPDSGPNGVWTATWDSTTFPDGTYDLIAKAGVAKGVEIQTIAHSITVDNVGGTPDSPAVEFTASTAEVGVLSGTTLITATVTNGEASNVSFKFTKDNVTQSFPAEWTCNGDSCKWSYSLDTTQLTNGSYTVLARATIDGESVDSESQNFTISNSDVPLAPVEVTYPADGSLLSSGGAILDPRITLSALVRSVTSEVVFLVSGVEEPYVATTTIHGTWTAVLDPSTISAGSHTITARAIIDGEPVDSEPITVTVTHLFSVAILNPESCQKVDGTVLLSGVSSLADSVEFQIINIDTQAHTELTAVKNQDTGYWEASWNTALSTNGTYQVNMQATSEENGTSRTYVYAAVRDSCRFLPPTGTFTIDVDMVTPHDGYTVSGTVPLLLSARPAASKAGFNVYKNNAGQPEFLSAHLYTSYWNADWAAPQEESEGSYTIEPIAWNGDGVAFRGKPVTVTRLHEEAVTTTEDTTSTEELIPKDFSIDPTATGTYSAMIAQAANPTIDVGLNIPAIVGPTLCPIGSLIKLADDQNPDTTFDSAVYYCARDGKRYAFPNGRIFFSWFKDFSSVKTVPTSIMFNIALGGNVSYRPGTRMIKITTDPKVYAVSRGGILRWITSETIAKKVYGEDWNTLIDDVSDAFFVNYTIGLPISE
jgi:hypothetical protein